MFDAAATQLIKQPFFFSQMLCVEGFRFYFWMSDQVSCPAQRQTSHCLSAEAPPCCCVIRPGSAVLLCSLPHPAAESLCCSGLPRQRQAASAVGVYLSRDGLPRQRQAASAAGVYLGRDGLPRQRLAASAMGVYFSWGGLPL